MLNNLTQLPGELVKNSEFCAIFHMDTIFISITSTGLLVVIGLYISNACIARKQYTIYNTNRIITLATLNLANILDPHYLSTLLSR